MADTIRPRRVPVKRRAAAARGTAPDGRTGWSSR